MFEYGLKKGQMPERKQSGTDKKKGGDLTADFSDLLMFDDEELTEEVIAQLHKESTNW